MDWNHTGAVYRQEAGWTAAPPWGPSMFGVWETMRNLQRGLRSSQCRKPSAGRAS